MPAIICFMVVFYVVLQIYKKTPVFSKMSIKLLKNLIL